MSLKISWDIPLISIIVANFLIIDIAIIQNWGLEVVFISYWLQSLIILIFMFVKMIVSKDIATAGSEHWKEYTGSYLDEGFLIDYLTPEEYFHFVGKINKLSEQEIKEFLTSFEDFFNDEILGKKKYIRDLSKGNQKKIGISAAIMTQPEILILDEPFSSLDPTTQFRLKKLLKELQKERQMTMLISSHDLNHVTEVCKRIVVLHQGDIVHDIETRQDTLAELEAYFSVQ